MTYATFYNLFGEALEAANYDLFVSERGWQPWMDTEMGGDTESVRTALDCIYRVAHMSVADIRATTGLSQAKFAERFCISHRTVQGWESNRCCPDYVRLMLADLLGLVDVDRA